MSKMGKPTSEEQISDGFQQPDDGQHHHPPPPQPPLEEEPGTAGPVDGTEELLPDQHIPVNRRSSKQRHSSGPSATAPPTTATGVPTRFSALPARFAGGRKAYGGSATDEETASLCEKDDEDKSLAPSSQPTLPAAVRLRPNQGSYKPLGDDEASPYPYPVVITLGQSSIIDRPPSHDSPTRHSLSRIAQRRMSEMSLESVDTGMAWQDEYRHRPSWCDARAALHQVRKGQAKGFKPALWLRGHMQQVLFKLGCLIQRHAVPVICVVSFIMLLWCVGLKDVSIQTDIVKLWVPKGGRLENELNFLNRIKAEAQKSLHGGAGDQDAPLPNAATGGIGRRKRQAGDSPPLLPEPENGTTTSAPTTTTRTTAKPTTTAAKPTTTAAKPTTTAATKSKKAKAGEAAETGGGGGFQVIIQTPREEGMNLVTTEDLLLHAQVLTDVATMTIHMYGRNWTLADLCFKPPAPKVDLGLFTDVVQELLDRIIPCIFISPLDCFWDGAKPLGPFPPIEIPEYVAEMLSSLDDIKALSWKNLDPQAVIKEINDFFDVPEVVTLFDRAGIHSAYQDRPCLDPLDPECPLRSPGRADLCNMTEEFVKWNNATGWTVPLKAMHVREDDPVPIPKVDNTTAAPAEVDEYDYYGDYDGSDGVGGAGEALSAVVAAGSAIRADASVICRRYGDDVRARYRTNPQSILQGLKNNIPKKVDLGKQLTNGCNGFASAILNWPEEMIIGGVQTGTDEDGKRKVSRAEAFQSVMMVASFKDLYLRYNESRAGFAVVKGWNEAKAADVITAWQRNFTELLYNYPNNSKTDGTDRQIHPLASTSVGDMLEEFSEFKFFVIFIGYFLMLCYAGIGLGSWRERGVQSCAGLGVAGVLLVTFASVAGLGASTVFGIQFNAATTQIVPFLTLGLGVDDMFLLVHSYADTIRGVNHNEIGHLLKETGLSVLLTSINNILAFSVGGLLPVPALRSFCFQTAILLFFNMVCIITLFPAVISLDLMRRKSKRVDILCCFKWDKDRIKPAQNERPPSYDESVRNGRSSVPGKAALSASSNSLQTTPTSGPARIRDCFLNFSWEHFVSYHYGPFLEHPISKLAVMTFFGILLIVGSVGVSRIELGLELTDVIPKGTAPYEFLVAREKHFSFYPMFGVIRGPIDFPNRQVQIHEYQNAITQIPFIVKNQGKTGDMYWLQMMEKWLFLHQHHYDEAVAKGHINGTEIDTKAASPEAKLAYRLVCQLDWEVDCSRNGEVKLVETILLSDGSNASVIRRDAFYNYLSAWVKLDNMMYYVTQADFFPVPPTDWDASPDKVSEHIPPANPPLYSQIPFFVNGLTRTQTIVVALRQIRAICDTFDANGLPNFPQGIPFTFWEQYLHLVKNLLTCLSIVVATVFVVISLLIMSPWSAAVIVVVLVCCIVELGGFMGLIGLKLNPVSAVTLITAVGIGVEFTVHISLSFLTNMGDRNERMQATLDHMFIPVIHGGISTLLGIIMLAFSEFQFIVLYFFTVLAALIVIGLLNGLVFLPVLLSLAGPPSEVRSVDGSDMVPPPSPKTVKRQISETGSGHGGLGGHHGASPAGYGHLGNGPPPTELNNLPAGARVRVTPRDSLSTIQEEPPNRLQPRSVSSAS